jgi:hypothetical protein
VVLGEGERPLAALVDSFATGAPPPERGVVTRGGSPAPLWEVERMDDLPVPDFDEYARLAEEQGILWWLPIEGSRGCWWDRTKRAGNPKATCYFCNLNVQWSGYREKSIGRVVGELEELTRRYEVTQVYFLDNIIRHRVDELARGISGIERDLEIFYEMRANVTPYELLLMWEAGLVRVQFGIEGLSSSFLRRIGKGTSVIQNLQVMKVCHELGIANGANLITDFPGSTAAEVEETCRNIESFAIAYEPCQPSPFTLGVDATVDTLHAEFGVEAIRNDWSARLGLPEEVWRRLRLFSLDFDCAGAEVSWAPVLAAIEAWQARRREIGGPLLTYHDGTSFLRVTDRRHGHDVITLHGPHRALYLDCMEIERRDRLLARHAGSGVDAEAIIDDLSAAKLLFEEDGKLLALATAPSARAAARRIRADAQARQNAARARGFGGRLPVVVG